MEGDFRHKKTGAKVRVENDCGTYVEFIDLPKRVPWVTYCVHPSDFLEIYEPVPEEPKVEIAPAQEFCCPGVYEIHAFSKRKILQVIREYGDKRISEFSSDTWPSFSDIAQRVNMKVGFVRHICIELEEENQVYIAGLKGCAVVAM